MTHEELVRRRLEIINAGELERLLEVMAGDVVVHDATNREIRGVEQVSAAIGGLSGLRPTATLENVVADGDLVAARYTVTGAHEASVAGVPPTGSAVSFNAATMDRVADGKIVETWTVQDVMSLMRQLGAIPPH